MVLVGFTLVWHYELGATGRIHVGITLATLAALIGAAALSRWSWPVALGASIVIVIAAAWALTVVFDMSAMAAGAAADIATLNGNWRRWSRARAAAGRKSFACARREGSLRC